MFKRGPLSLRCPRCVKGSNPFQGSKYVGHRPYIYDVEALGPVRHHKLPAASGNRDDVLALVWHPICGHTWWTTHQHGVEQAKILAAA